MQVSAVLRLLVENKDIIKVLASGHILSTITGCPVQDLSVKSFCGMYSVSSSVLVRVDSKTEE